MVDDFLSMARLPAWLRAVGSPPRCSASARARHAAIVGPRASAAKHGAPRG
jgi:hypothetical protein